MRQKKKRTQTMNLLALRIASKIDKTCNMIKVSVSKAETQWTKHLKTPANRHFQYSHNSILGLQEFFKKKSTFLQETQISVTVDINIGNSEFTRWTIHDDVLFLIPANIGGNPIALTILSSGFFFGIVGIGLNPP